MRTLNLFHKTMIVAALSAALSGCPLAAQKDAVAPSEEKPSEAAAGQEFAPASGDKSALYEFFRRRVFIDGKEVWFSGTRPTFKGRLHAHTHEHRRVIGSKLRMMLTDPRFDDALEDIGEGGDLLRRIIRRLFGDFTVSRVLVNVLSVQVRPENADWQTIVDFGAQGQTVDLMAMSQGALLEMGTFALAPGKYTKVRLNLAENNKVEVDEGHGLILRPLRTPSRAHERIELVQPFEIETSGLTTLVIDFDVNDSIKKWFGSYWIQPKLKILSASTSSAVKKTISAAQGGVIGVFGEIVVSIPPGALSEDTEVSLTPVMRLSSHETENLFVVGHEYLIGPADVVLAQPATVALSYEPRYAPHLGIDPDSFDLYVFNESSREWYSTNDAVERGVADLTTTLSSFGRIVVGGVPLVDPEVSGPGCEAYGDAVMVQPTKTGLDLQYFASACNQQALCYAHGFRTYRLEASACNDALKTATLTRCDDLCKDDAVFGKACSAMTPEELAGVQGGELTAALYENCLAQAANLHEVAVAAVADRYPGHERSTCLDYEGRGISCAAPTCALTVDQTAVKKGVPVDLNFMLHVTGSVDTVTFDGTVAYQQEGLALPIDQAIVVSEIGRILEEPRVFGASIASPSGVPVSCSVTVDVVKDPDPCTVVFTPDTVTYGDAAGMFVKVAPGFVSAVFDFRSPGTFINLPLGAALPDGSHEVVMNIRPQASREFTIKVKNAAGEEFSCKDYVNVIP